MEINLFPPTRRATFIRRPNRFIVMAKMGGRIHRTYLPNPGRLQELLLPNCRLWLAPSRAGGKTAFTVVAVEGPGGEPVILHTGRINDIAQALLTRGLVPGLERATIQRREVPRGNSRFDFLLALRGKPFWLEVKSCSLLSGQVAMFPDAITARGRRHLEELGEIAATGEGAGVLFIVGSPQARAFTPDWHTDLAFARTFLTQAPNLLVRALPITVDNNLAVVATGQPLPIPHRYLEREVRDGGAYILLLELTRKRLIPTGARGQLTYPPGYYLYVGSATQGLDARIARHRRNRKKLHWHIDYLRQEAQVLADFPIRSSRRDECELARAVGTLGITRPKGFGAGDCKCEGHLFHFDQDPRHLGEFHQLLGDFRSRGI